MLNKSENNNALTLARFFKRINQGEDPKLLRKEAGRLVPKVKPVDITTAERNLIKDGYSPQTAHQLSATFMLMGIPEAQRDNPRTWLAANHILRTVLVEHDLTRCFLADLNDVVTAIAHLNRFTDKCTEFRKLAHIVRHLNAMKEHIEREDDVIFPCLIKYGWTMFCRTAQCQHVYIRTEIDNLVRLTVSFNSLSIEDFKTRLIIAARRLLPTMLEHLSQEDIILYPIALEVINDAKVWIKMKAICDEIGYCGTHL